MLLSWALSTQSVDATQCVFGDPAIWAVPACTLVIPTRINSIYEEVQPDGFLTQRESGRRLRDEIASVGL